MQVKRDSRQSLGLPGSSGTPIFPASSSVNASLDCSNPTTLCYCEETSGGPFHGGSCGPVAAGVVMMELMYVNSSCAALANQLPICEHDDGLPCLEGCLPKSQARARKDGSSRRESPACKEAQDELETALCSVILLRHTVQSGPRGLTVRPAHNSTMFHRCVLCCAADSCVQQAPAEWLHDLLLAAYLHQDTPGMQS